MNFFRENPGIVGKVMRIILEYLGFIEATGMPEDGDPAYQYAHAIVESVGRLFLLVLIFVIELKVAQFFGL